VIPREGYRDDRSWWSPHQRLVVLTFPSVEDAEAWDAAGRPMDGLIPEVEIDRGLLDQHM